MSSKRKGWEIIASLFLVHKSVLAPLPFIKDKKKNKSLNSKQARYIK